MSLIPTLVKAWLPWQETSPERASSDVDGEFHKTAAEFMTLICSRGAVLPSWLRLGGRRCEIQTDQPASPASRVATQPCPPRFCARWSARLLVSSPRSFGGTRGITSPGRWLLLAWSRGLLPWSRGLEKCLCRQPASRASRAARPNAACLAQSSGQQQQQQQQPGRPYLSGLIIQPQSILLSNVQTAPLEAAQPAPHQPAFRPSLMVRFGQAIAHPFHIGKAPPTFPFVYFLPSSSLSLKRSFHLKTRRHFARVLSAATLDAKLLRKMRVSTDHLI